MVKRDKKSKIQLRNLLVIVMSFTAVNLLVYFTKGINIYWHLYAIPLVITAFTYNIIGAAVLGIVEAGTIAWWIYHFASYLKSQPSFLNDKTEITLGVILLFSMGISLGYLARKQKSQKAFLERISVHDRLTGLYNYSFCIDKLTEEKKRSDRYGTFFSLVMIDIDFFKVFNDQFGHEAGNEALKKIAEIISKSTRNVDVVCRYGGEEFAILLPQANTEGALALAERIRQTIESTEFCFESEDSKITQRLTVSAGIAAYPFDARSESELIVNADSALYQAKLAGRNKICVYSELVYEQKSVRKFMQDQVRVLGKEVEKVEK
jgi:diguanylate cyclase (GGDEF)-like protein